MLRQWIENFNLNPIEFDMNTEVSTTHTFTTEIDYSASSQELVAGFKFGSLSAGTAAACFVQIRHALKNLNGLGNIKIQRTFKLTPYDLIEAGQNKSIHDCAEFLMGKGTPVGALPQGTLYDPVNAIELFSLAKHFEELASTPATPYVAALSQMDGVIIGYRPIRSNPICVDLNYAGSLVRVQTFEYPVLYVDKGVPKRITTVHGAGPISSLGKKIIGAVSYSCTPAWVQRNREGNLIAKVVLHG